MTAAAAHHLDSIGASSSCCQRKRKASPETDQRSWWGCTNRRIDSFYYAQQKCWVLVGWRWSNLDTKKQQNLYYRLFQGHSNATTNHSGTGPFI
jgi:hypothetical protein